MMVMSMPGRWDKNRAWVRDLRDMMMALVLMIVMKRPGMDGG
jgi:hypothetical protein